MPEYLDDPSVLTKDKLKTELLAHNVELPSGNPNKEVYVQLYLNNLTARNKMSVPAAGALDAFSSDEELPPPVVSSRSRSSGRKATRKTDKVQPDELDVTVLTDEGLRDELLKHGVDVGPIVASTRKLYEKKLQKLLDNGPAPPPEPKLPQLVLTDIQVNHNGKSDSDLYSDKEDEVTEIPEPEPEPEPAPAPVVERPVRSRGKTPVTTRTRSSQHHTIVPEDLRPVLTDPVPLESNRRDSPARAERRSSSSRRVQIHREELGLDSPRHSKDSSVRPVALLNTALLEDPRPKTPQSASRPSTPLVHLTRAEPLTLSPMCKISPIKRPESPWTGSDRSGSEASGVSAAAGECGPPDVLPHRQRQQTITGFLSAARSKDVWVEKITASDQNPKVDESDVLKELYTNDISSPTGISATCRRPIRGAAGRPLKPGDLWNSENCLFSPKVTKTSSSSSSYTESRLVNRVASLPRYTTSTSSLSNSSSSSSSRPLSAAPPAVQTKAVRRGMSLWIKLFLLAVVAAFLFLVYQAMETNSNSPFETSDTEVTSGSTA